MDPTWWFPGFHQNNIDGASGPWRAAQSILNATNLLGRVEPDCNTGGLGPITFLVLVPRLAPRRHQPARKPVCSSRNLTDCRCIQ
jgi:hypothetical protein